MFTRVLLCGLPWSLECRCNNLETAACDLLACQGRLSILCWDPDLLRSLHDVIGSPLLGPWQVVALQELSSHLPLHHSSTSYSIRIAPFISTRTPLKATSMHGYTDWALRGVCAQTRVRRVPLNERASVRLFCVHSNDHLARRKSVATNVRKSTSLLDIFNGTA